MYRWEVYYPSTWTSYHAELPCAGCDLPPCWISLLRTNCCLQLPPNRPEVRIHYHNLYWLLYAGLWRPSLFWVLPTMCDFLDVLSPSMSPIKLPSMISGGEFPMSTWVIIFFLLQHQYRNQSRAPQHRPLWNNDSGSWRRWAQHWNATPLHSKGGRREPQLVSLNHQCLL